VIITVHDDVPVGFACQSFAALSLEPPLVLFCPTNVEVVEGHRGHRALLRQRPA
jgi:flavin reductase (DIM6/NTAB) family NADH-FMN oxidoreductase RutF